MPAPRKRINDAQTGHAVYHNAVEIGRRAKFAMLGRALNPSAASSLCAAFGPGFADPSTWH
jgi:hypothetical protein